MPPAVRYSATFCAALAATVGAGLSLCATGCGSAESGASAHDTPAPPTASDEQWFTEITESVGLRFTHTSGGTGQYYLPEITGGGAALFDFDNDGDLDIYLVNSNELIPELGVTDSTVNRLYRQEPDGTFTDVTEHSGLADGGYGQSVAIGDIDNDGFADVYVGNVGPDQLYRNRGDGTFENITDAAEINVPGWSCSAAFFDYDRDGWLDLYITQYLHFNPDKRCHDTAGRIDYCGPRAFRPATDVLLRNTGDGRFVDVTESSGIASVAAAGMGVVCDDFNDDGWVDLYVANDAYANNLWINQHDGTFTDMALVYGAAFNLHGHPEAGMGVVAADLDDDVDPDLFVTHLEGESNTLYRNQGARGFVDVTGEAALGTPSMPFTGFGIGAMDIELDGDIDLIVANGRVIRGKARPSADTTPPWDELAEPNHLFLNRGEGRFELDRTLAATITERLEISRAIVTGDIDNDGDCDVLMTQIEGPARLYRNEAPRQGAWLTVSCMEPPLSRPAIGAQIRVRAGDRQWIRTVSRAGGFNSSHDPRAHFGLGDVDTIDAIEVRWPDGTTESFAGGEPSRFVTLRRGEGDVSP